MSASTQERELRSQPVKVLPAKFNNELPSPCDWSDVSVMPAEHVCGECRFWRAIKKQGGADPTSGKCRKYPSVPVIYSIATVLPGNKQIEIRPQFAMSLPAVEAVDAPACGMFEARIMDNIMKRRPERVPVGLKERVP